MRAIIAGVTILLMALSAMAPTVTGEAQGYTVIRECRTHIVAVSSAGGGVAGNLTVRVAYPGAGRVYISTSPASMVDTQGSARIAAFAASLLAGVDMTSYDYFYDIESDSIIIGGPSAGFAMALATLLALENATCSGVYAATGMIQPDTSIGPVGGLKEKLEAASSVGVKLFLIPAGQSVYTYYQTKYERIGPFIRAERVPVSVNLTQYGQQLGVRVETAATLEDGYRLVRGSSISIERVNLSVPGYVEGDIYSFIGFVNSTVQAVNGGITNKRDPYINSLTLNATKALAEAGDLYGRGLAYPAVVKAVESLQYAYAARYADQAMASGFKVTGAVGEVNSTINTVYELLSGGRAPLTLLSVENLANAWGKLAVAAYYYQAGLNMLASRGSDYYLPAYLGGVDPTPLLYLGESAALAALAQFWYNLSITPQARGSTSVDPARLARIAELLQAEASSATAYLETLLQEAGADTSAANLPAFLTEEAIVAGDPLARIGFSIESIAYTTIVIHDTFTLEPARTASELSALAQTLYERAGGDSVQVPLLLSMAFNSSDQRTALLASSRAVLYGWLAWELSQTGGVSGAPITQPPTQAATTTPLPPPTTSEAVKRVEPAYTLMVVVATVLSLLLGVAIGGLTLRRGAV